MMPSIVRSPVEICLATSPSQAPKSRPLENTSPVPIAATMALEMIARCQAPSSDANIPDLDGPVLRSPRMGHRCADPDGASSCELLDDTQHAWRQGIGAHRKDGGQFRAQEADTVSHSDP